MVWGENTNFCCPGFDLLNFTFAVRFEFALIEIIYISKKIKMKVSTAVDP